MTVHIELGDNIKLRKKLIGYDKTEKGFFSINAVWNRCHHHLVYGKNNMKYM
jgi:hypothetical protein